MNSSDFHSKRISKSSIITLNAPLKEVFPLFGPIKEKLWAEGWEPQIIYSKTSDIELHMIFKTKPPESHSEEDYLWIVSKYSPEQSIIEYTVFTSERVWFILIECSKNIHNQTSVKVTYTYTGLTERGNLLNEKALQAMFSKDLKDWEEAINYYLETGNKLKEH